METLFDIKSEMYIYLVQANVNLMLKNTLVYLQIFRSLFIIYALHMVNLTFLFDVHNILFCNYISYLMEISPYCDPKL